MNYQGTIDIDTRMPRPYRDQMTNIFVLWSGGHQFTNESGWSSNLGALSYRGVLKGLSYRSTALNQRIVVTTAENQHLIKLKRRMFIVSEHVLRAATTEIMQKRYWSAPFPSCLPPYYWGEGLFRILGANIQQEWVAPVAKLMNKNHPYIVITTRVNDNEITRAMRSVPLSRSRFGWKMYTTSSDHDITMFKLMSGPSDIIIDTEKLRNQAIRYYDDILDIQ